MDHNDGPGGDQGTTGLDGKSQMLKIAFIGVMQMFFKKGLSHGLTITQFDPQKKSQICDAGQQHWVAGSLVLISLSA